MTADALPADRPTRDDFFEVAAAVKAARFAEDLFGDLGATREERLAALAAAFRRVARALHPDRQPPSRAAGAHAAFVQATALRDAAERAIRAGTYGDRRPVGGDEPYVVTTRTRAYRVGALVARGDLCDLYECSYDEDGGGTARAVLKIVARAGDSDLLENEARVLGDLFPAKQREVRFLRYLPRLVDSFVVREAGMDRRAVVLPRFDEHVSLEQVTQAYPAGIDFRDAAWMVKRLLAVLGFVHRRGFVHAAVLPPHLLVHPVDHGARLVDFCYAVPVGERARAICARFRDAYPPEVAARRPVTAQTDIFMAARCALALMGSAHVPRALRTFFETCLAPSPSRRPDDAWALHDELDELLRRLVGPPTYRHFAMPNR